MPRNIYFVTHQVSIVTHAVPSYPFFFLDIWSGVRLALVLSYSLAQWCTSLVCRIMSTVLIATRRQGYLRYCHLQRLWEVYLECLGAALDLNGH